MKHGLPSLEQVLHIPRWQALQDSMARVSKLAIITVNYMGVPVTQHSSPRPFCQKLRANPALACRCQKCDSRGGLEAVRTRAPYIYLCHCGIVDIAIPIMVEGHYIGALLAGQVRQQGMELEQIMFPPSTGAMDSPEMRELYYAIPVLPAEEIQAVADMLFHLCSYVVEEAVDKQVLAELCQQRKSAGFPVPEKPAPTGVLWNSPAKEQEEGTSSPSGGIRPKCWNTILRPALDYIYENKGEPVTQQQMAALCHVSTSYFSRLFTRVFGEGFTTFLARQKIEWSKQLLEHAEYSVSQISDQLGFSSSGYYIKTFKKFEHVTPAVYRKFYLMRSPE